MNSKPKNFQEALLELENLAGCKLQDLDDKIESLKPKFNEIKDKVNDEAKKAKDKVEVQVKENPWAALGIVSLIFFLLGYFFASRGSRRSD